MKYIYCDGGCRPTNPGPGGYGVVMFKNENEIEKYTKFSSNETTNNRMELEGLLCAIKWAAETNEEVIIYTDSAYARNSILNWVHTWSNNGWVTAKKQPVLNRELIEKIYDLYYGDFLSTRVKIEKVSGHTGIIGNELVDALSKNDINKFNEIIKKNNINLTE